MPQESDPEPFVNLGRDINVAAKLVRQSGDRLLAGHDTTITEWITLRCLEWHPGSSQREIAGVLGVEGATMTHHLDRMERNGLIERAKDPADRRVTRVSMSRKGAVMLERLGPVMAENNERLAKGISHRDLATFRRVLAQIVENAEAKEQSGDPSSV